MDKKDRQGRDSAGVGPYAREREQLVAMSTLSSWTLSEGEPDIRGWDVSTVSGRQLGTVCDLLIDREEGEVVLLDVDLPGTDRHTFVPIRVVAIDRTKRLILMDSSDLPTTGLARGDLGTVAGSTAVARTVRYPSGEREVKVTPTQAVDGVVVEDATLVSGERRQLRRREEDRLNPDT